MSDALELKVPSNPGKEWERIVFAEVLIPDTPNTFGDISSREDIVEFVHEFARQGYGLDVEHDEEDVRNKGYYVVESFIARDNDPDFIPGSWVVGCKIVDDDLWTKILEGKINGYSYQAEVYMMPVVFAQRAERQVTGVTSPDPIDGHTHDFAVVVDPYNHPIAGGTSESMGHTHRIAYHTVTCVAEGHNHRYQVLT